MELKEAIKIVYSNKKDLYISLYSNCHQIQDYELVLHKQIMYIKKLLIAKNLLIELEKHFTRKQYLAYFLYYHKQLSPEVVCNQLEISYRTFFRYKTYINKQYKYILQIKLKEENT